MLQQTDGLRGAYLLPVLVAFPLALTIALIKPSLILPMALGALVLVVAFLSPLAGLYALVFSMLLGPEVIIGALGEGTTLGRGVTIRFDDLLLVLVGFGWLGHTAISDGGGRFLRTALNRPIALYTAACVFATLMGMLLGQVKPAGGIFFLLKYYEYFFLYFMVVNIVSSRDQIRNLVKASLLTCLLVSLYALWQIPGGERVSAPFEGADGEPNTLGGYLVFMMGIVSGLLLIPGAVRQKLPLFGLLGLGIIALEATLSRTSFLAAGGVVFGVLWVVWRRSTLVLGLLLMSLVIMLFILPTGVTERVTYTFTQPEEQGQIEVGGLRLDTSTSDRLRSWQGALTHFLRSPLWGAGVTGGPFMDAMYPRVLTETGLLGMAAFLYLLYTLFWLGRKGYRSASDPFFGGLALGFLLGFIGLLIHAIGANTFIIVRIMEPFWLYAALVARGLTLEAPETGAQDNPELPPIAPDTHEDLGETPIAGRPGSLNPGTA